MQIELALGREGHVLPQHEAQTPKVDVGVEQHEGLLHATFGEVRALGAGGAAEDGDRRLDRVYVVLNDGRVEVAAAA